MNTYYVSLVKDLLGCYIKFNAESESALRAYLVDVYMSEDGTWKLPWCSVYEEIPKIDADRAIIIRAKCGDIFNSHHLKDIVESEMP